MTVTAAAAINTKRFARQTTLAAHEYHKNFHKIDEEVIACVTSEEADAVTPLMSKIYLRLVNAPGEFWEQRGVLHFTAREREGKLVKASSVLSDHLGVSRATAAKALQWMHKQGVIGYHAGKNGVGVRVFLNRAISSIGTKTSPTVEKILRFPGGSSGAPLGSRNEPAFKDTLTGVSDSSDQNLNPHAPKNGADAQFKGETLPNETSPVAPSLPGSRLPATHPRGVTAALAAPRSAPPEVSPGFSVEQIVARLKRELGPSVEAAAEQAAARAAVREHVRTREWLDRHGIPKATRVAQKEAFNVLRSHGVLDRERERARAELEVGRSSSNTDDHNNCGIIISGDVYSPVAARPLTAGEIAEIASTCVALYEAQGKAIDETLGAISAEAGGWVPADDVPKVREAARALIARALPGEAIP